MWPDRIVELWQDAMRNQIDPLLLFSRELPFCFVKCRVPRRLAEQSGLRFRGANEFENHFVTDQSSPAQLLLICENKRCSSGFHLEAPVGECVTMIVNPNSFAICCSPYIHRQQR